ncbi:MAG: undecaprenyl-diphosphate phosphatase, partial [Chitinophagaceae bacterium]
MNSFEAILIAIVEGLTEYLPISSTGHMIITEALLRIPPTAFVKTYTVAIQLGAILAVVVLYRKMFLDISRVKFFLKLLVAVCPALVLGALLGDQIDRFLESPLTVAITMLTGGIVLLFIDHFFRQPVVQEEAAVTPRQAFIVGLWQCIALLPGVSRSAATIIGGLQQRFSRKLAAEFSFYLAVPTMCAATGYKILKSYHTFTLDHLYLLVLGNLIAFVVAVVAIRFFLSYLQQKGFRLFGWYRILVGITLLILIQRG